MYAQNNSIHFDIVDSNIAISGVDGACNVDTNPHGVEIKRIISLTGIADKCPPKKGIKYLMLPTMDEEGYDIKNDVQISLMFIADGIKSGEMTLVHCYAGMSRSATVVLAYLMSRYKWSLDKSINFLRKKRPIVNPNQGFMKFLKEFEKSGSY